MGGSGTSGAQLHQISTQGVPGLCTCGWTTESNSPTAGLLPLLGVKDEKSYFPDQPAASAQCPGYHFWHHDSSVLWVVQFWAIETIIHPEVKGGPKPLVWAWVAGRSLWSMIAKSTLKVLQHRVDNIIYSFLNTWTDVVDIKTAEDHILLYFRLEMPPKRIDSGCCFP